LGFIALVSTAVSGQTLFALDEVHASCPSSAPIYISVGVTLQQGFFREQNLDVKLTAVDVLTTFLKSHRENADGMYPPCVVNCIENGYLNEVGRWSTSN
jgi:hypothetical protein